ncbi:uncharacterized protein LOC121729995 isoform X5 [Aricia agestis]|uniref:uncharacterized protein LOC121729995 isoform X5 n=1 Tax=Aricia agestis TaxID=91739 RepID=UPI001C20590F|nr:uncharacterized protein LOC121729995 isoform X5 [Aricia agestis]
MLHETWPSAYHRGAPASTTEIEAFLAEVNNNSVKEDADGSPPPAGYAPSPSRRYEELRPAHGSHARDMQAYVHLEEALFKGSTDGAYLRRDLTPSPDRADDYRLQYQYPAAPPAHPAHSAPPPYDHDHHHQIDSAGGAIYSRAYSGAGSPYFPAPELQQTQLWTSSAGTSPSYATVEEYAEGEAGGAGGEAGAGGALPPFGRFTGAFASTSRPGTVYGSPAITTNAYEQQSMWSGVGAVLDNRRTQYSAAASLSACGRAEAAGRDVQQLPDLDDVAVAPQRARRDRLQRLRPVLQAAQHQQTARHEEGLYTDEETETKERHEVRPRRQQDQPRHRQESAAAHGPQRQAREPTGGVGRPVADRLLRAVARGRAPAPHRQAGEGLTGAGALAEPRAGARARAHAGHVARARAGARLLRRRRVPARRGAGGAPRPPHRRVAGQLSAPARPAAGLLHDKQNLSPLVK